MLYMMMAIIVAVSSVQRKESFEGFISGIRANAVKGEVFYQREGGEFDLEAGHKLQEGDFIKTETNSYAELLLQPGNYLRIGGDSELQIFSDPYDKMRLKLNRGSITVEILSREGEESSNFYESLSQRYPLIRVITPNAEVFITRSGIFRINSSGAERTELIARDGEAAINGRRIKEKRSGVASSQGVAIADMTSKTGDSFDAWCRARADELVSANRLLKDESPWAKNRKEGDETSVEFPDDDEKQSKSHRLVVSAKPGAINFVETGVELSRQTKEWESLAETAQLETGDKVRTSAHTFAEITILPDINLRIDSRSEILFEQLSNEGISMKLLQGSAILDVVRFDKKELPEISLVGASTSVVIADEGNYRIDIKQSGDEITVRDGKVFFKQRSVGGCHKIVGGTVSDCEKRGDNLDFWSDHRGEGTFYNGRNVIATAAHLERLRQQRFRNTGFWYQSPGETDYTFVPFSLLGFRSPYGGSYSTVLSPKRVPMFRPDLRPEGPDKPWGRSPRPPIVRPVQP